MRQLILLMAALATSSFLGGCGTVTPEIIVDKYDNQSVGRFVNQTALHVRCELRKAVIEAITLRDAKFLHKWSAKITMTVSADEKTSLAAGLSTTTGPLANSVLKSFTLGLGGSLNQRATRKIDITWFEDFEELIGPTLYDQCNSTPEVGINGDLKLTETLFAGVWPAGVKNAFFNRFTDNAGPLDTIQNTITFDVEVGGTGNPAFVFTNVSVNPAGSLVTVDRDRMDQLLITMGPLAIENNTKRKFRSGTPRPSPEVDRAHDTGRFGLQIQSFQPRFPTP